MLLQYPEKYGRITDSLNNAHFARKTPRFPKNLSGVLLYLEVVTSEMKVWWYIAIAAAVILCAVLVILLKKRRKRREMEQNAEDRLREEALDRVLVGDRRDGKRGTVAFDVKYDQGQRNRKGRGASGGQTPVMLQLTEKSELSTRKYMLHAAGKLSIGSQADLNDIVITGDGVEKRQCEIVRIGKQLFVHNLGKTGQVLLKRGRKQIILDREAVELEDNDVLYIGDFTYKVTILRN